MEIATKASRWKRIRRDGHTVITPRDIEVFKLLARYKYLPSNYIHAFVGGYYNDFCNRLRKLYDCQYLHRPESQRQNYNANYTFLAYELDKGAIELLRQRDIPVPEKKTSRMYPHELMACQIAASIELGARNYPALNFGQWKDAPVAIPFTRKGEHETIVPDWQPFFIEGRFFAGFEADCGTEPINASDYERSSIRKKFIAYLNVLEQRTYRDLFSTTHMYIPFITTTRVRMESMMALLEHLQPGAHGKYFLFKHIPSFTSFDKPKAPDGHMLIEPWATLNGPLYLNQ